jgi:hypothetical protein
MKIIAITHNPCESNHNHQNPLQSKEKAQKQQQQQQQQQQSNLYRSKNQEPETGAKVARLQRRWYLTLG